MSQPGRREARLKPEFAHLYPAIHAGHWELAAVIAERVLASLLNAHSGYVSVDRVLGNEHFEFRSISVPPGDTQRNRIQLGDSRPLSTTAPGRLA